MDLQTFLDSLVAGDFAAVAPTAIIVGALVWAIIEGLQKLYTKDGNGPPFSPDIQFWLAIILSFGIPLTAYVVDVLLSSRQVTLNGLFLAFATGYAVSQGIHWAASGSKNAHAAIAAGVNTDLPKDV